MPGFVYVHDLSPVLFHLGPLTGTWYGLMYAIGFLLFYFGATRTARWPESVVREEEVSTLLTYFIIGLIVGARVGYVLFYGTSEFLIMPWKIFQTWKGGMSFHGGMLGITLAMLIFSRRHQIPLLRLADFSITWAPLGLFFGRMGNFINGELFGSPTGGNWGVIFPADPQKVPRHPSQLYEGVLEGLLIFAVLMVLRYKVKNRPGIQGAVFLTMYAIARILVEFVRVPDAHIGYTWGWATRGMFLSFPMLVIGLVWLVYIFRKPPEEPVPLR